MPGGESGALSEIPMRPQKIVIVGLGLIGGSLGLTFRKKNPAWEIIGLSRTSGKIRQARKKKAIDWGSTRPSEVLPKADVVFICTPVSTIPSWIARAERYCRLGTVVTDVGSTKQEIIRWVEKRSFKKISFVGSHPMAGSHQSGIDFSREDLFLDSITFVTKTPKTNPQALKKILLFWKRISKRVFLIDPTVHDQIVAQISHTPHALAALLVLSVSKKVLPFAASGFLDTTRISQGDPLMWRDILVSNRKFLARSLRRYHHLVARLIGDLEKARPDQIHRLLKQASKIRRGLTPHR